MTARTQTRILDAAERAFADCGYQAASLRRITVAAKVNLAAVHYHFGAKKDLLQAVLARRLQPLNRERLRLLDECEAAGGRSGPTLEAVLEALVGPALRLSRDGRRGGKVFMHVMGRLLTEPNDRLQAILHEQFAEIGARFLPALKRALPGLPEIEFFWRLHFLIGAMAHTLADTRQLEFLSRGKCNPDETEQIIHRLVTFLAAGLRAPVAGQRKRARQGSV